MMEVEPTGQYVHGRREVAETATQLRVAFNFGTYGCPFNMTFVSMLPLGDYY